MKKKYKRIIITISVIVGLLFSGWGVITIHSEAMHAEMMRIVKKHQDVIFDWIRNAEKDDYHRDVQTITIQYNKLDHNPMGGIDVYGYVNHNKKQTFCVTLDKSNGKYEVDGGTD